MTTNEIKYVVTVNGAPKEVTFTNRDIEMGSGKIFENNAMVAETLEADTIDVIINMQPAKTRSLQLMDVNGVKLFDVTGKKLLVGDPMKDVDPSAFLYGETIKYYRDGVLDGKFYARQARQIGKYRYSVEGISAVGLLIRRQHNGGMYFMERVGDIIEDIMGSIPYTIDDNVADLLISGWLPAQSARDNLQQVLFAGGVSISKDSNKDLRFMFLGSTNVINIPNNRIYNDGRISYRNQVTGVDVTEHAFYVLPDDLEITLFDNTDGSLTADRYKAIFDEPVHDLVATGLTIHESNCNYAIVSGVGTLSGKLYTHTQRVLHIDTGQIAEENVMTVSDAYMVTAVNSYNVAQRVANYYGRIHETSIGVVMSTDDVKPSAKIQFLNPFGSVAVGYIHSSDKVMSGVVRSDLAVVTDWEPGPFGSNFTNYDLVTASGNWTVPAGVTRIRAHLIGGGKGGWSGQNGTAGESGSIDQDQSIIAGNGDYGISGNPGESAKFVVLDIDVTPGQSIPIVIGEGGAGGSVHTTDRESTEGTPGGATTMLGRSSEEGVRVAYGLVNLFTGEVYALDGEEGIRGTGGDERTLSYKNVNYEAYPRGTSLEVYRQYGAWGAQSGRPAAGTRGTAGQNGYTFQHDARGGAGGAGGDAVAPDDNARIGGGGHGGNGGGGGGGGGDAYISPYHTGTINVAVPGVGGRGGYGSKGGKGGPGGVLIYW